MTKICGTSPPIPRVCSQRKTRRKTTLLKPGDVVVIDFLGAAGINRRPAVVLSSEAYHSTRPDVILGSLTSHVAGSIGPTDYVLVDWAVALLRLPSLFRSFAV